MTKRQLETHFEQQRTSTIFHQAVLSKNYAKLEFLLNNSPNFDLNTRDLFGDTVLDIAVFEIRDEKIIDLVLFTTSAKYPNIMELLFEIKKNLIADSKYINKLDLFGRSALHYAVLVNRPDIVECLLRKGSDINTKDKNGQTPVHYATILGSLPLVEIFYNYYNCRKNDKVFNYVNPFAVEDANKKICQHLAITHNHLEIFSFIIKYFPSIIRAKDEFGNNVLHLATSNPKICAFLLKENKVPCYEKIPLTKILNVRNFSGQYPIDIAVETNNFKSFKVLLNLDKTPQENDNYDNLVYLAAQNNILKSFKLAAQHKNLSFDEEDVKFFSEKLLKSLECVDISRRKFLFFQLAKTKNFLVFVRNSLKTSDMSFSQAKGNSIFYDITSLINNFWQNNTEIDQSKTPEIFYDDFRKEIVALAKELSLVTIATESENRESFTNNIIHEGSSSKSFEKTR